MEALNEERKSLIPEYDNETSPPARVVGGISCQGWTHGRSVDAREELSLSKGKLKELEHRRIERVEETLQSVDDASQSSDESVPVGADEDDNVVVQEWGKSQTWTLRRKIMWMWVNLSESWIWKLEPR